MAVQSVQVKHSVTAEQTSTTLRKIITYRIACDDQLDGGDVITAHANIPKVNISAYVSPFKYGNDGNNTNLICRSISNLRKVVAWSGLASVWELDAEFFWDRDQTPSTRGVKVEPITIIESEVVEFAEFVGWYKPQTTGGIGSNVESNLVEDTDIVDADVDTLDKGKIGPVTNSAGTPTTPAPEIPKARLGLLVSWIKESAIDSSDFIGHVNDDTVNIADDYSTFDIDFAAGELLCVEYNQTPVDIFGDRLFETSAKFEILRGRYQGDHIELDRGLAEYVDVGDDDGNGGTYGGTQDLPPNKMRPITVNGQPITKPIPFNGKGKAIELFQPQKARYLRWRIHPEADFNLLEIGDYT